MVPVQSFVWRANCFEGIGTSTCLTTLLACLAPAATLVNLMVLLIAGNFEVHLLFWPFQAAELNA